MRYIEKNFDTDKVKQHELALSQQKLDEASLLNPDVYPGWTGDQLFENKVKTMETFPPLKQQMFDEQGGVCCYSGMKLDYPFDPQYRVEHVRPKGKYRELVGEYKNLLLSCRANREELKARNEAENKTERKKLIHCDEAKGSTELTYSPLDKACEGAFCYKLNGEVHPIDEQAENDIKTLGLNGPYLIKRRQCAIDSLIPDDDMLSDDELRAFREGLKTFDSQGKYKEFYFVLIDAINQLLPTAKKMELKLESSLELQRRTVKPPQKC